MRYIIVLICCLCIGCNTEKKVTNGISNCKKMQIAELQRLGGMVSEANDGVYIFDHGQIPVPQNYDTIEWQTITSTITQLDSTTTQYMIYKQEFQQLLNDSCSYKVTTNDLVKYFGTPTTIGHPGIYYMYMFNRPGLPPCYNKDSASEYRDCSMIVFTFDAENMLEKIDGSYFFPN